MVLRRVGTPKKIVSETEPAYEERAVWVEVDSSGNIVNQYVGFFDEWILIDTNANFPVHFDFLQASQPALDAGKSWLEVTSFVTNTIDTPTSGNNTYEFNIASLDDVFNVNSVTVLGNSSSASRGPVTITDSGSATVNPQGTRVEDATVTFTGVKSVEERSYSANSAGTIPIQIDGNTQPTGPANGSPQIDAQVESFDHLDFERPDETLPTQFTIPSDWPSGEYSLKVAVDTFTRGSPPVELTTYKNGQKVNEYYAGDEIAGKELFSINLSPGDQLTTEQSLSGNSNYAGLFDISLPEEVVRSYTATTSSGQTLDITSSGTYALELTQSDTEITISGSNPQSFELSYVDQTETIDPSVSIGSSTVSHTGVLTDGETVTKNLSGLTPGSYTANVSVSGPLSTAIEWTDITETADPTISLNGNTTGYNGVLKSGDSVNLDIEKSWLIDGTNTLELISGSPASLILEYDEVDTSGQTTVRLYFSDGNNWYEL